MAEKKSVHEIEVRRRSETVVSTKIDQELRRLFEMRCEQNGTTMSSVLRDYIKRYVHGEFVWD